MTPKNIHKCNKEIQISVIQKDLNSMKTDIALLTLSQKNQNEKIDAIHKALLGDNDGDKGLVNDYNRFKGATKAYKYITGAFISVLTIIVTWLGVR